MEYVSVYELEIAGTIAFEELAAPRRTEDDIDVSVGVIVDGYYNALPRIAVVGKVGAVYEARLSAFEVFEHRGPTIVEVAALDYEVVETVVLDVGYKHVAVEVSVGYTVEADFTEYRHSGCCCCSGGNSK